MTAIKRSLYQCFNARVLGEDIYCSKGHEFYRNGGINIRRLIRGERLELTVCQDCGDYLEMGPPIPKEERGW